MTTVLLTAFEPYGPWRENASWLALVELTKNLPEEPKVITRRYPVDFAAVRDRLADDLAQRPDYSLHVGQAPGAAAVRLERVGLNLAAAENGHAPRPLLEGGPPAYLTSLPLEEWAEKLRQADVPATVSHHAGLYLCNAVLYFAQHLAREHDLPTSTAFVHVPLAPRQVAEKSGNAEQPAMPSSVTAEALRLLLEELK